MKKLILIPISVFAVLMLACEGETEVVEVTKEVIKEVKKLPFDFLNK